MNLWDCRICQAQGWDRENRICYLRRAKAQVIREVGKDGSGPSAAMVLTREEVLYMLPYEHVLSNLEKGLQIHGEAGKIVCPIPIPPAWVEEIIRLEANASEYGLSFNPTAKLLSAFSVIREAKAEVQDMVLEFLRRQREAQG